MRRILFAFIITTGTMLATSVTYNFEDQPDTSGGALTSITENSGGLTMTVTRQGGAVFDIANLSADIPSTTNWGHSTLSPFADTSANAFIFTFSKAISSFSVQLGDFDADFDTETLTAYSGANGTGSVLAVGTGTWGNGDISINPPGTDSVAANGIFSVLVIGGSPAFPNSLYYDNVTVNTSGTITPEPASVSLLLGGLGIAGLALRRRLTRG